MSGNYKKWDSSGPEASKIIKQFQLHKETKGQAGIDPNLKKPLTIVDEVYNKHQFLQQLNPKYFPDRFRKLALSWNLNQTKERKREGEFFTFYNSLKFSILSYAS